MIWMTGAFFCWGALVVDMAWLSCRKFGWSQNFNRLASHSHFLKVRKILYTTLQENFYNALKKLTKILPPGTIKSLTGDRGEEFAWYQKIENELRIPFYFADPHSPWQKGSNENTNGLLRENFPKRTNFSAVSQRDLYWKGVYRINNRPRKVLGWKTAQECFAEELRNSA